MHIIVNEPGDRCGRMRIDYGAEQYKPLFCDARIERGFKKERKKERRATQAARGYHASCVLCERSRAPGRLLRDTGQLCTNKVLPMRPAAKSNINLGAASKGDSSLHMA
jgi:hypothetical protein